MQVAFACDSELLFWSLTEPPRTYPHEASYRAQFREIAVGREEAEEIRMEKLRFVAWVYVNEEQKQRASKPHSR